MLTKLIIRNFKRFDSVEIELGNPVVFIGPNNSGKTTALQALALWHIGLRRWQEKRGGKPSPEKRTGVTINRRDLVAVPIPNANLLWRDLHVRNVQRDEAGQRTDNVRIEIVVEGVDAGAAWQCGLEFDYANEESFYCRLLRTDHGRMAVPEQALQANVAFMPPMSGLAANEIRLDRGAINVRIGEGRTAEVLRNLCYQVQTAPDGDQQWREVVAAIKTLFGVTINDPVYIAERGEIVMTYRTPSRKDLDLSTTGRGLQQMLLLLTHLALNPNTALLLDEPDAHLEILRQRQLYQLLNDVARKQHSQIISASHSEVILNEAADRDVVVAFVGLPHRIDDRGGQVLKSLKDIGFEQYYQAEQKGWVLYLEGSTDLAILREFARNLKHPALEHLEQPFVSYVLNLPAKVRDHFYGLREAKPDLVGFALFDRLDKRLNDEPELTLRMWRRREIENYLCTAETLDAWLRDFATSQGPLFVDDWTTVLHDNIIAIEQAFLTLGKGSPWSPDTKVSDDFLTPLFDRFFATIKLPNLMRKTDFHSLARFVPQHMIDAEVTEVLDAIGAVARRARPEKEAV